MDIDNQGLPPVGAALPALRNHDVWEAAAVLGAAQEPSLQELCSGCKRRGVRAGECGVDVGRRAEGGRRAALETT